MIVDIKFSYGLHAYSLKVNTYGFLIEYSIQVDSGWAPKPNQKEKYAHTSVRPIVLHLPF